MILDTKRRPLVQIRCDAYIVIRRRDNRLGRTGDKGKPVNIKAANRSSRNFPELRTIIRLAEQGKLTPVIDRVLPLRAAAEAHRILEARENFGKICLQPDDIGHTTGE